MKKLYKELFEISDNKKIPTKVFINRMMLSTSLIITCLLMTSYSAYAYFSMTITSHNTITSAFYSLSVENKEGLPSDKGTYELEGGHTYHFILDIGDSTASVGYASITLNNNDKETKYYVNPIGTFLSNDSEKTVKQRAIQITVPENSKFIVVITPEWGSCALSSSGPNLSSIEEISLEYYKNVTISDTDDIDLDDVNTDENIDNSNLDDNNENLLDNDNQDNNNDENQSDNNDSNLTNNQQDQTNNNDNLVDDNQLNQNEESNQSITDNGDTQTDVDDSSDDTSNNDGANISEGNNILEN